MNIDDNIVEVARKYTSFEDNSDLVLRGCLKKIDKVAFSLVFRCSFPLWKRKSDDFEQNLVWLGLNSQS